LYIVHSPKVRGFHSWTVFSHGRARQSSEYAYKTKAHSAKMNRMGFMQTHVILPLPSQFPYPNLNLEAVSLRPVMDQPSHQQGDVVITRGQQAYPAKHGKGRLEVGDLCWVWSIF
jgi:hypothetical protein